jgi:hypothetical protein
VKQKSCRWARFAHHNLKSTNTSSPRSETAQKTQDDHALCPLAAGLHPTHTFFRSARSFRHIASQHRYKIQLFGAAVSVPRSMMAPHLQRARQAANS